jgi:hypothetical protein
MKAMTSSVLMTLVFVAHLMHKSEAEELVSKITEIYSTHKGNVSELEA